MNYDGKGVQRRTRIWCRGAFTWAVRRGGWWECDSCGELVTVADTSIPQGGEYELARLIAEQPRDLYLLTGKRTVPLDEKRH